MIDSESILLFFGTGVTIWMLGFTWGKATAWLREIKNAA